MNVDLKYTWIIYNDYKTIVEIGVQTGVSAHHMCRAAEVTKGHYYGYDIWAPFGVYDDNWPDNQKDILTDIFLSGGIKRDTFTFTQINTFDSTFPSLLNQHTGGSIDFAFIDGCHSYDGIKNDFEAVYPLLTERGSIMFHDTYSHTGPRQFVLDLYNNNDGTYDIINLPEFGIDPEGNKIMLGMTILMKRFFQSKPEGIINDCHEIKRKSLLTPEVVYNNEKKWLKQ